MMASTVSVSVCKVVLYKYAVEQRFARLVYAVVTPCLPEFYYKGLKRRQTPLITQHVSTL